MSERQQAIQEEETLTRAWDIFRLVTATDEYETFTETYIGSYASRSAFGEHLLHHTYGAAAKLAALPKWLQGYLRVDGEAVSRDFERAGHFRLVETESEGIFVFDASLPVAERQVTL